MQEGIEEDRCEGVTLRSLDYKERQRIITVFTEKKGLISLIVKGMSKKNPHLLSLTSPFCRAEFLYKKKRSDLFSFQDGTILDPHLSLRNEWRYLQAAGQLCQLLLQSQLPGKPAPAIYSLFCSYLKRVVEFEDPAALIASFQLKLLRVEGLIAFSGRCAHCGSENARYLQRGETSCPLHATSETLFLSDLEWGLFQELLLVRSFENLKTMRLPSLLSEKISRLFEERIQG